MSDVTVSATAREKSVRWHQMAHEAVAASAAAGMKIALGTDARLSPNHGTNLQELGLLVRFGGLTHMQAIVAGTRTSAELCGLERELGTVETGKIADMVVVRGDPLSDIDAVGKPKHPAGRQGRCRHRRGLTPAARGSTSNAAARKHSAPRKVPKFASTSSAVLPDL
ncbi:hypothetical protein EAH80_02680 [Mycobacterium hodleri]|uniref:Amidohydrolase-related domain-containing protein n=1 Tax=Mycolicibacterium hodleri TaxID=49897 RepID=A0A502EK09_9MYCO|nr:hypothetical protein EAH80_02680 [Mycolicibacterium hodleri]